MRVAVVGAGIFGSCAAYELASAGAHVELFEQFEVDHDRGGSFGDSRIIRRFYDDPYYTALMTAVFPLWRRLEAASGQTLYEKMGGLYFGPKDHERLASASRGMRAVGASPILLDAVAMRARFPAFTFADDEAGIMDEEAGSLCASRCVRAAVSTARGAGATVRTNVKVDGIATGGASARQGIEIRTAGGEVHRFDRAVICAGPWSTRLLAHFDLPVRPTRQQYVHLRPTYDAAKFQVGSMPIWIDAAESWYGFPEHGDVPGVKLASHDFGETVDPDNVNRNVDDAAIERTRAYARRRLPALAAGDVTFEKTCLYVVSPDEDFIVDFVPGMSGCVFVAGCSGHGFKFGPLVGAIAADLALDRAPRVDISRFRLARFEPRVNDA